jgi:Zn-dependent M28 family amino/carboxypeptidase
MAGKFGLDPHQLDDETLVRELRFLFGSREESFFHGSRQALLNHPERKLQLEREYANRFPERTRADALRTRKGARGQSGQPTSR